MLDLLKKCATYKHSSLLFHSIVIVLKLYSSSLTLLENKLECSSVTSICSQGANDVINTSQPKWSANIRLG
jgi:hypothetical protein